MVLAALDQDPPLVAITAPMDGAIIGAATVELTATVADASETRVLLNPGAIETRASRGWRHGKRLVASDRGDQRPDRQRLRQRGQHQCDLDHSDA